jgi:uncharacterized protein YdhG (YjbR/CyaY superfamily)
MVKAPFKSVEDYIASQPEVVQKILQRLRTAICKAVPDADEMISYNIPAFKLGGKPLLYFAAWKEHYSLYPATARLIAAFKNELEAFEVEKHTIRFSFLKPVPVGFIGRLAKFRAKEISVRKH